MLDSRLNRDQIMYVVRLAGCENFVVAWEEFVFNVFINREPVQRSEDGCDIWEDLGALTTVREDSSESAGGDLFETKEDCSRESYSSQV